ncbi:MAG: cation diffusion facilitator family transporter [Turneriella sp.]
MAHQHDHSYHHDGHGHDHASKNLLLALVLNLGFAIVELVGGLYTNSVAILSDALHDFGDSLSLGVAWYLQRISGKPRDEYYSYGYRRFSLLGALVVSSVLLIGVALVIRESIERLLHPEAANVKGMLLLALLGVAVNGFAALRVKKGTSLNERAVYLHLLEDALGWIAVLIGGVFMYFYQLPWLDPLLSLAIAGFILFNVFKNLRSVVRILLMEVPGHVRLPEFEAAVRRIKEVKEIDDLHVWTLDGQNHVLTMQVIVSDRLGFSALRKIKQQVRTLAQAQGIRHSTIEFCCSSEDRHQHH